DGPGRARGTVARGRLCAGWGSGHIDGRPYLEMCTRPVHQSKLRLPFDAAELAGNFGVHAKVAGGGVSAWADAIAHGIARALVSYDEKLRPAMRKAGLLTRDSRIKERKKPGLKRARKAPQYTKR